MVKRIKKELRTWQGQSVLGVTICLIALTMLFKMEMITSAKSSDDGIREIKLEIRSMAFAGNNPDLHVRPGETVRFIIHNLDPGMKHEFQIPGTDITTRLLEYGEKDTVLYQAPDEEKEMQYICNRHSLVMHGRLSVKHADLASLPTAQ